MSDNFPSTAFRPDDAPGLAFTAAYDPADNRLRLRASRRIDREIYDRVKAAGFSWAPKQQLFVAPAWSPEREDLLVELCGEIGDDDTSLVDRAEERADRFDGYREKRADEAHAAKDAVEKISEGIPLGSPILVGHHSEKRARKDAERIESGMRKAVKLWATSEYWTRRAAGALRHAKYKELAGVRHRRIKGLEADKRKHEKAIAESSGFLKAWRAPDLSPARATEIANWDHQSVQEDGKSYPTTLWSMLNEGTITAELAAQHAIASHEKRVSRDQRWVEHIDNRLAYERAMLGEQGGIPAEQWAIEPGGRALVGREWLVVLRVNKKDGKVVSFRPVGSYVRGIETVTDYRAPAPEEAAQVAKAAKLPPIVNYPSPGCLEMTKAEWGRRAKSSGFYMLQRVKATDTTGVHRRREGSIPGGGGWKTAPVFLTDAKRVDPPAAPSTPAEPVVFEREVVEAPARAPRAAPAPTPFDAMKETLKAGVQVVVADQLFPTPPELARMVVERCDVANRRVLEPSAGLGVLVAECLRQGAHTVRSFEIDERCCQALQRMPYQGGSHCPSKPCDFLAVVRSTDRFGRIVMNPPFSDGQDVTHVTHAIAEWLAPGGRLVAIMSAGVKFRSDKKTRAFRELVEAHGGAIEDLPEGSFRASGTDVRTVLVTIDRGTT